VPAFLPHEEHLRLQPENHRRQPTSLKAYHGKVVLLVNVASKCGFTPQYAGWKRSMRSTRTRDW